jgi:hypothetical protein
MLKNAKPPSKRPRQQRASAGNVRERGAEHARPVVQQPDRGAGGHLPSQVAAGAQHRAQQSGASAIKLFLLRH